MNTRDLLRSYIEPLPSMSLIELTPLALLDRTDTKFVVNPQQLCELFAKDMVGYRVLQVENVRLHRYYTSYFDTPDLALYFDHHNGKRERYKLRCRSYLDSGVVFAEVKMKTNKERTVKYRLPAMQHLTVFDAFGSDWLPPSFPYRLDTLQASVWNRFVRVTLANFEQSERITIDMDITFGSGAQELQYEGLCVIEMKQPKYSLVRSPFGRQLHHLHLQPQSISKFCIAAAHFYPGCKVNLFKPLLLQLAHSFPLRGPSERIA